MGSFFFESMIITRNNTMNNFKQQQMNFNNVKSMICAKSMKLVCVC